MSEKPANVLLVVPDADALQRLTGSLAFLSTKKYRVHVGVQSDAPGAQSLASYDGLYAGLSVSVLPVVAHDRWRALATMVRPRADAGGRLGALERALPVPPEVGATLDAQRPDVLVITRLRGADAPHLDYVRAARARGIPTVYVTLGWDELRGAGLANEWPDCVAVWNRSQRRDAVEAGLPVRRTCTIGAPLATDLLDERVVASREEYCRALGVDPARRLVLLALPRWQRDEAVAWARAWNTARLSHSPVTRDSHVIVVARGRGDAEALERLALPGVAAVIAAEGNPYTAAQQMHAALEHADAVVALDQAVAFEAFARTRPVLAFARHADEDLARLCRCVREDGKWPRVANSIEEQLAQLAEVLAGGPDQTALTGARSFVRVHGNDVEPAFLLVTRLIREITPRVRADASLPGAARSPRRLAALARLVAPEPGDLFPPLDGKVRFLMAFESAAALEHWSALSEALVARGHRVSPVLVNDGSTRLRTSGLGRSLSALRLGLSLLDSSPAPEMVRWRRRLEAVELPGWTSGLHVLARRPALLNAARRLSAAIDRHLPGSRHAARLVRGARPGAVIALPSLEPATAVTTWAAQADVLRAVRARGLPAAAGVAGSRSPIDDALAAGALRPQGVNHTMADALAEDLERWMAMPDGHERAGAGGVVVALAACGALAAIVAAAFVAGASSAATRATSRTMLRVRGALGRGSR